MVIRYRTPFAPEFNFVVKRPFTNMGREYAVGEELDKANVNVRLLQKLYDMHKIDAVIPSFTIKGDIAEPDSEPVSAPRKRGPKPKIAEPAGEQAEGAERYQLVSNFNRHRIMDNGKLLREYDNLEEAQDAFKALTGE